MARSKRKDIDPSATLDQAAAAVEAGHKTQARTLLKAYRRWRLSGNAAPPGGDEGYGELVDRSGPQITRVFPKADETSSARPLLSLESLRSLAQLVSSIHDRTREKYKGVVVDPLAALREAELSLDRGDLETAGKHIGDYEGFRTCGGEEPPGGKKKHDLLLRRLSALKREPW
jgi:hypothetical protein